MPAMAQEGDDIFGTQGTWTGRALLLVDLDAFFASVEQLDHPAWRGKPVIVGGRADRRGVVSTASYEARAFGVHSAMPSATAERLCPDAIWTCAHFDRYHEVSDAVMQILRDESPLLEQMSIDEAYLDISPGRFARESPVAVAERIQRRVAELGVTCSIGVGTGKAVAKIASDLDKPQGLSVVYPGSEAAFLAPMDVRALPGIGKRSAERLHMAGIKTLGDLASAELEVLRPVFGVNAKAVRERAGGIDTRGVESRGKLKSVSHERTFVRDLAARSEIEDAIDLLGSMVGRRLRRKGLAGRTVTLKLRYADLSMRTARKTLAGAVDDEAVFIPHAKALVDEIWRPGELVRLVGVGISGFEDEGEMQLALFDEGGMAADGGSEGMGAMGAGATGAGAATGESTGRHPDAGKSRAKLVRATDAVRDKFGEGALKFGREMKLSIEDTGTRGKNDGTL